jgi:hypothetical protein
MLYENYIMMNVQFRPVLISILLLLSHCTKAQDFSFATKDKPVSILYSKEGPKLDSIAAQLLAEDIMLVTGTKPKLTTNVSDATGNVIVIGNINSTLIQKFINRQSSVKKNLQGRWECFALKIIENPVSNIAKAFVIAGSDARGMAYGVFTLSEKMGVSPWHWWADVPVKKQPQLIIHQNEFVSSAPSVKYRGIFINDEDWGLQPWAAKTFEPGTGDIGPKTYAKVFELLLRLKANLIWPAMHPSTKAFFHYPGNVTTAGDYQVIIGSSHAEPMLRNNIDEWNEKIMGHFNYITNKDSVYKYWEDRVKESVDINAMFTIGMRGIHDSQMEGIKNAKEAVPLLENIFKGQRDMLAKYRGNDATAIPQVFTAYKEVLDIYDNGLRLPEDVTLVWPDDNYGYIQRLNNEEENERSGGSGVYYHASYWGRPHDYLWLSSTHPSLIREEMMKAYITGANRLWVLNVGDIKPLEYNISMFMDMAYNAAPFQNSRYVKDHLTNWVSTIFGNENGKKIENVLWKYYQLAFERKPEFMGWSQTEPTTKTKLTAYNHFYYGDEAQKRIDQYEALEQEVKLLKSKMNINSKDAFYQLVYYPVMGTSLINKKFLYRDKAVYYANQNRLSAIDYAALSKAAYDSIEKETGFYNTQLAGGKWNNIMSMKPRDLPVYQAPEITAININGAEEWSIAPEGLVRKDSSLLKGGMTLPDFDDIHKQQYFIDIFLSDRQTVSWTAAVSHTWIKLSQNKGVLTSEAGKNQKRIWVNIDWSKLPVPQLSGEIIFKAGDKQMIVEVNALKINAPALSNYKGFIENNGFVSMHAANFSRGKTGRQLFQWQVLEGLGCTGKVLQALPFKMADGNIPADTLSFIKNNASVEYDFYTFTAAAAEVSVFTLPTHPLNNKYSMRYAVSVDDGPLKIIDFRIFGRSEEWKQNVLSNRAERKIQLPFLKKGNHTLKIFAVDPGVILDEIRIDLGGLKRSYGILPETK